MEQKKTNKTAQRKRPGKYAVQYKRTAKNTELRRARHAAKHPKDVQARDNWTDHRIRYAK